VSNYLFDGCAAQKKDVTPKESFAHHRPLIACRDDQFEKRQVLRLLACEKRKGRDLLNLRKCLRRVFVIRCSLLIHSIASHQAGDGSGEFRVSGDRSYLVL